MPADRPPNHAHPDCARFDAQLGAWLEHDLDATRHLWMSQHRQHCAACDTMVRELEAIVTDASALPNIAAPRDLWSVIEARLDTPVLPLPVSSPRPDAAAAGRGRSVPVRWFALAATLLVAVSSGITWQVARGRAAKSAAAGSRVTDMASTATTTGDADGLSDVTTEFGVATPSSSPAAVAAEGARGAGGRFVSGGDDYDLADPSVTYEREITALRHIVDERFAELDSTTVTELRRNLDIIDRAISDSRAALARDPRSGVVSSQLDRALQAKLDLLRRVALL